MPKVVTTTQIQKLQSNIRSGGSAAAASAYATLYASGYNYAGWALGVVSGNSVSGQAALSYLQNSAAIGLGTGQCSNLTPAQVDKIFLDMALETLEKYRLIAERNNGQLDRDLTYQETRDIHEKVFTDNSLALENWTLHTPMELVRDRDGEGAVEQLWQEIRDTGGDYIDATSVNIGLFLYVHRESQSDDPDVSQRARIWLDTVIPDWFQADFFSHHCDDSRNDSFNRAKNWTWPRDPIILDLDGNGLETVGLSTNIHFDHNGDGVLTRTGWVGKTDALLVWDRNTNGTIDTGAELFGDFTRLPSGALAPNGFAALAALDANGDGIIDASDPAFAELKLWRDTDQNGVTGEGELISLADAGIASLGLTNTVKNQSAGNGNTLAREGGFTRTDGSSSAMGEFHFATDTFSTRFAEEIEVPEALKSLPTMQGSGNVRELQQSAALSGEVAGLLSQFQFASTRTEQKAVLDELITAWAGTSNMAKSLEERAAGQYRIQYEAFGNVRRSSNLDAAAFGAASSGSPASGGALMSDDGGSYLTEEYRQLITDWNRKIHVLEAFNGQHFFNLPQQPSQTSGARWGFSVSSGSRSGSGAAAVVSLPTLKIQYSTTPCRAARVAICTLLMPIRVSTP